LKIVLGNRPAVGYILGYGVHCWKLFGYRSWLVAFLVFNLSLQQGFTSPLSPQNIAMIILLAGVPASIAGNEGAMAWGRRRALATYMIGSGLLGCVIGFTPVSTSIWSSPYAFSMAWRASLTAGPSRPDSFTKRRSSSGA